MNIAPVPKDASDAFVSDLAELAKSTVVDSVAYCCTLVPEGDPPMDKAAIYAKRIRAIRDRLRAVSRIRQGVLFQATIGHGWKPNSQTPWQKIIGGKWGAPPDNPLYKFCPLGSEFLAYIARAAKTLAAEMPDFFMVEKPRILSLTAREIADIGEGVDVIDEMDTCPQNRYSTSATRMIDHAAMAAFEGCVGGKIWNTRFSNPQEARS